MEELYRDDTRVVYVEQANADGIVVPVYRAFEIRDGLDALLPGMTLDQYAVAMAEALRAAELAGRYEVLQEAGGLHA